MVLAAKYHPSLPPLLRLGDPSMLGEEELKALMTLYVTKNSPEHPFIDQLTQALQTISNLTGTKYSLEQLVSPELQPISHGVSFLIFCNLANLGTKPTSANPDLFDIIPLPLFDILHFSAYEMQKFQFHSREARLAREQQHHNSHDPPDSKDRTSQLLDCKWTKRAIQFASYSQQPALSMHRPSMQRYRLNSVVPTNITEPK